MRDEKHYKRILDKTGGVTMINATLAGSMIYASRHGKCDTVKDRGKEWSDIIRALVSKYGEDLTVSQVRTETGWS